MLSAVRAATAGGEPPLDAVLAAIRDSQPGEPGSDTMARLVLRAALEQRRIQQAIEHAGFPADSASQNLAPKARRPAGTPAGEPTLADIERTQC